MKKATSRELSKARVTIICKCHLQETIESTRYNNLQMPLTEAQKQVLSKVPIFSGLSERETEFVASRVIPRKYSAGQIVFSEGDSCSGLYVVGSGHVRIYKTS